MKTLTPAQVRAYKHDGYLFPFDGITPAELQTYQDGFDRYEKWLGKPVPKADLKWRALTYLFLPWVDQLVRHPAILDVVEDVIGPDILVYMASFFVKDANSSGITAWHQDATYFGLSPHDHVTAWVALTEASELSGCMEVVSNNGNPRQLRHEEMRSDSSINSRGQMITEDFAEESAVAMPLHAGQFSLHHTLCTHRSEPNRSDHRRIGLGISYIPAHVKHTGSVRLSALLVRGQDKFGHFDPLPSPNASFEEQDLALHERTYTTYRKAVAEQSRLHQQLYPPAQVA